MASIFVAKLDFGVTDEELKELFEQYGTVVNSHIAKDKETRKPRGFAFVEMSNTDETSAAIGALDGHTINGREIVVKLAEDRSNSKPSFNRSSDSRPVRRPEGRPASAPRFESKEPGSPFLKREESSTSSDAAPKTTKRGKGGNKKGGMDRSSESKENKMTAYKKSGKNSRYEFSDDDDWELEFKRNNKEDQENEDNW